MADIFDLFRQIASKKTENTGAVEWIVVGLGNPGEEYRNTRHNAGFLTIDAIADSLGVHIDRMRFHALTAEASLAGKKVLLLKPMTLMNASGTAVTEAAHFYKIPLERILVISDDINLDVARLRLRPSGSDGGQRGLKSIIACFGSNAFPRLRVGVGAKPHPDYDLASWVLSTFSKEELSALSSAAPTARAGIEKILSGDFDGAVQLCNSHRP